MGDSWVIPSVTSLTDRSVYVCPVEKRTWQYLFQYQKMRHCARLFLILGYFFLPLEDVKLRQLTRRRRLHNLQLCEIFSEGALLFLYTRDHL